MLSPLPRNVCIATFVVDGALAILCKQVLEMGIETYNKHCRGIVTRYSKEWERTIKRLGRWIDFENDYKTMVRNKGCDLSGAL